MSRWVYMHASHTTSWVACRGCVLRCVAALVCSNPRACAHEPICVGVALAVPDTFVLVCIVYGGAPHGALCSFLATCIREPPRSKELPGNRRPRSQPQ